MNIIIANNHNYIRGGAEKVFFDEIKQTRNRFNSKQFELYNELWNSLIDLKFSADDLWASANKTKLHDFSKKVYSANISIDLFHNPSS